jgi:hypothetical protein
MWLWVVTGIGGAILLSLIISLAIAKALGHIANQISAVASEDAWVSAPLTGWARDAESDDATVRGTRAGALDPRRLR